MIFKKGFLSAALGCLCASAAFAGTMGESDTRSYVRVSNLEPGLSVLGGAVLLQPTTGLGDYGLLTNPFPVPSPSWQVQELDTNYTFGFEAGLFYSFKTHEGADMRLKWTRLTTTDTAHVKATASEFVGAFYEIGPNAGQLRDIAGKIAENFNFITFDFGQAIDIGERFRLRMFGGLDYLYIKQNLKAELSDPNVDYLTRSDKESRFSGVGPRLGLAGAYEFRPNIAFTGLLAGSVSVGTSSPKMSFESRSQALTNLGYVLNRQAITAQKTTQAIPGIEGRIGFEYRLKSKYLSECVIEAGYEAAAFIDVITVYSPSSTVVAVQTGSTAVATMTGDRASFGINGPYLAARVHPNV